MYIHYLSVWSTRLEMFYRIDSPKYFKKFLGKFKKQWNNLFLELCL